jgi:hypothetical protein
MTTGSTHEELSHVEPGILDWVGDRVRQLICGLHGHDALLHYERDRLSLMCTSCSYESPGWEIKRTTKQPQMAKATVARLPLVSKQRVA